MKAVVIRRPNRALFGDEADPVVGNGQVLVKVALAGVCMSDVEVMKGTRPQPYVKYPIIPGHEWCGTVVQVGSGVKRIAVGVVPAGRARNNTRSDCLLARESEVHAWN